MSIGWISIHRELRDCWVANDKPYNYMAAWVDLLLMASHKDTKLLFDGNLIDVKRGSFITSILKLSDRWGWSRTKTKKFLDMLVSDNMIEYKSDNKKTAINIVNYSKFQDVDEEKKQQKDNKKASEEQQKDNRKTSEEQQKDTINNDKQCNNNINNNIVSKDTICRTNVQRAVDEWNKLESLGIKKVSRLSSGTKRYESLKARINQYGIDEVLSAIQRISKSKYLKGENKYKWTITFDWFVLPNNFPKVMEGNYDDTEVKVSSMYEKAEEQFNYTFNKYPNKNNYDSSKKAWSEIVNGNEKKAIDIYNAVVYYIKSLKNDELKFVKSMDKWLREDSEYWIMSYKRGDVDD